jgi:hypothetical protein
VLHGGLERLELVVGRLQADIPLGFPEGLTDPFANGYAGFPSKFLEGSVLLLLDEDLQTPFTHIVSITIHRLSN